MKTFSLAWPEATAPLAVQALMIDLDGTIADTMGDFDLALNAMLRELELPAVPPEAIKNMVGKGSENLVRSAVSHVGASLELFDQAIASYQQHYGDINGERSVLYPGVAEALQQWHVEGLPMACLTNKPQMHAEVLLRRLGVADYFQHVFGGDAFARKKPDPLPLLETARALGSSPEHTLMLGDSMNDAQAAHAAGCPVLLVDYGYNHGEPIRGVNAHGYLASMAQLQVV